MCATAVHFGIETQHFFDVTHEHLTEPKVISVDHEHHLVNIHRYVYEHAIDQPAEVT